MPKPYARYLYPLAAIAVYFLLTAFVGTAVMPSTAVRTVVTIFGVALPMGVLLWSAPLGKGWLIPLGLMILLFGILTIRFTSSAILEARGEQVSARVSSDKGLDKMRYRDGRIAPEDHLYALTRPDGEPISGLLHSADTLTIGGTIDVVADPAGWAEPKLAGEVGGGGSWIAPAVLFALITGLSAIAIRRCGPHPVRPSPAPPRLSRAARGRKRRPRKRERKRRT